MGAAASFALVAACGGASGSDPTTTADDANTTTLDDTALDDTALDDPAIEDAGDAESSESPESSDERTVDEGGFESGTATTAVEPAAPVVDFAKEPFVTFAPVPPRPSGAPTSLPDGSEDFHALFDDDAPWQEALGRVDGFKLHSWMIRHYLTDEELIRIDEFLRRHGIALMIEAEPLDPPDPAECDHTESYEGPYEIENAQRLNDLGIVPAAYAIEQPFSYGHRLDTPGACRYELDRVLDEVVSWAGDLREIFPGIAIGSIEALWERPTTEPGDFGIWIDAYTEAMGEPPAFQHVDVNWAIPNWHETLLGIEVVVESRGVPFGPLYNGFTESTSRAWVDRAIEHIATYELVHGGTPGHVTIQSWYPQPDRALPETDPAAMTHLLNRYFGARPVVEVAEPTGGAIVGVVVDQAGEPVDGVPVTATARPGPGSRQSITMRGEVPAGAEEALLLWRSNFEDSFDVAAGVTVHSMSYTEEEGAMNAVPNGDFSAGLDAWGVYDDNEGSVSWVPDDGDGAMRVTGERGTRILIDGPVFATTPGATFEVALDISVDDDRTHGAVGLAFLADGVETGRRVLEVRADDVMLGSAVTADDGSFDIPVDPDLGVVTVRTPGDLDVWPAVAPPR